MKRLSRANVSHTRRRLMRALKMRYIFRRGRNHVAETIARSQRGRRGGGGGRKRHLHSAHTGTKNWVVWPTADAARWYAAPANKGGGFCSFVSRPRSIKKVHSGYQRPPRQLLFCVYYIMCVGGQGGGVQCTERLLYSICISLFVLIWRRGAHTAHLSLYVLYNMYTYSGVHMLNSHMRDDWQRNLFFFFIRPFFTSVTRTGDKKPARPRYIYTYMQRWVNL